MSRAIAFLDGITAYAIFFVTFLYAIGFVGNIVVPKSIDTGMQGDLMTALVVNVLLLSVFALQHSIMARPGFKRVWTKVVPDAVERSTYVLLSSLALVLIFALWRPMTGLVWDVTGTPLATVLQAVFWVGWLIVLTSTFMINHFDLFGMSQVYAKLRNRTFTPSGFRKLFLYRLIRHPIMTGFLIAFWATPTMSTGHLLFAAVTSTYILIAVLGLEEKDLIAEIGDDYVTYRKEVGAFFPKIGGR